LIDVLAGRYGGIEKRNRKISRQSYINNNFMKTIYFLLICIWLGLITGDLCAQPPIQKEYRNETYTVYGWTTSLKADTYTTVVNSKNTVKKMRGSENWCPCTVNINESVSVFSNVIKSVLSAEKRKLFADDKRTMDCFFYYDAKTGQIIDVEFTLKGVMLSEKEESLTSVTLKEIHQMEILFKKHQFKIDCNCSEFKFGYVIFRLLLYGMVD